MAYHKAVIPKGIVGEVSKIREELTELEDALVQGNRVMALVELSDLYGSMMAVLKKHFPSFTMNDLRIMAEATISAFEDGSRK